MSSAPYFRFFLLLALGALAGATRLLAQDAVMAAPAAPLATASEREAAQAAGPSLFSIFSSSPDTPFQAGSLSFRPRFNYRYMNAEDLPVGSRRIATEIHTFSPGFAVDLGRQWSFDYMPTWTYYTARAFKDTVDESASLRGSVAGQNWALQFTENFSIASPTLIETAQQTKTRSWLTSVGASRSFGQKVGLQLGATLAEEYTDISPDTRNWSTQNWLTVQLSPSISIGAGPGAGYIEISGAPDMTFERYLARVNWKATDKLMFAMSGGMEYRHSNASDGKDMKYPTIDASVSYQPFATTQVGFTYSRSISNSYFRNQVTKGSSWSLNISQRLLQHFYLSANWSHQDSSYEGVTLTFLPPPVEPPPEGEEVDPEAPIPDDRPILISLPGRSDKVDQLSTRLTFQFLKRLSFSATYQRSKNHSSAEEFSFNSTQYGFEIGFRY